MVIYNMKNKFLLASLVFAMALSLWGCSSTPSSAPSSAPSSSAASPSSAASLSAPESSSAPAVSKETVSSAPPASSAEPAPILTPESSANVAAVDPGEGEGIGKTQPLTDEEMDFVLGFTTKTWFDLSQEQKGDAVAIIARWWDLVDSYIVTDFDELLQEIDHQAETYNRNKVDAYIFDVACEIRGINSVPYTNAVKDQTGEGIGAMG